MQANLSPENDATHDPQFGNTSNKDQEKSSSKTSDSHAKDEENDDGHDPHIEIVGIPGEGTTSQLCNHCQWMLDNWFQYEQNHHFKFPHHKFSFQMEEAALSGCGLCHELSYKKRHYLRRKRGKASGIRIDDNGTQAGARIIESEVKELTRAQYEEDSPNIRYDSEGVYHVYRVLMTPAGYSALRTRRSPEVQESIRESIDLAARWLEGCRKSHGKCNHSSPHVLPTRLVSTGPTPRLCLSQDIRISPQYATLSYCWGEDKRAMLTKDNFSVFQEQIPPEALSKTIQDAIEIANRLGFPYLWIDKFCIVQDNLQDWERESSLMTRVYGGSSLNIAASGARDGSIGCFFEREQFWKCQAEVNFDGSPRLYDFVTDGLIRQYLSDMPLMERGWALQERLLAPRTLHFTRKEMFWECYHNSACETFPERIPQGFRMDWTGFLEKKPFDLSMWNWTVQRYGQCKLTYQKDKLVAISGLARHIQNQTGDQYISGLWKHNMVFQLCWANTSSNRKLQQLSDVAPTWSWASTNNAYIHYVDFGDSDVESSWVFRASFIDAIPHDRDADPFGPISKTALRIHCDMLFHVWITYPSLHEQPFIISGDSKISIFITWDVEEMMGEAKEGEPKETFILPLMQWHTEESTFGIMLHPIQGQKGIYQRIGYFCIKEKDWPKFAGPGTEADRNPVHPEHCWEVHKDEEGKVQNIIELI